MSGNVFLFSQRDCIEGSVGSVVTVRVSEQAICSAATTDTDDAMQASTSLSRRTSFIHSRVVCSNRTRNSPCSLNSPLTLPFYKPIVCMEVQSTPYNNINNKQQRQDEATILLSVRLVSLSTHGGNRDTGKSRASRPGQEQSSQQHGRLSMGRCARLSGLVYVRTVGSCLWRQQQQRQ